MKTFQKAPLALAITALLAAPYALAEVAAQGGGHGGGHHGGPDIDVSFTSDTYIGNDITNTVDNDFTSDVDIEVDKKYKKNIEYENVYSLNQDYDVSVDVEFEGYSSASVSSMQLNGGNSVSNDVVDNSATVGGNALRGASGNIGVNVAAGDNNQQANDAALAASDADKVFSIASATSLQGGAFNSTTNVGVDNSASLGGNALRGASGNIGVNIASGNSNLQQNSLAASVSTSTTAEASAGGTQVAAANTTNNAGVLEIGLATLDASATGFFPELPIAKVAHNNSASLGGNAVRGATGNIGVNIASGSNNMQRNSLALSASMGSGAN